MTVGAKRATYAAFLAQFHISQSGWQTAKRFIVRQFETCTTEQAGSLGDLVVSNFPNTDSKVKIKSKALPITGRGGPYFCETPRFPHFLDNRLRWL
jgi:hypothetical protein